MTTIDQGTIFAVHSLGQVSYAFYILHQFVHFCDVQAVLRKLHIGIDAPPAVQLALELFITLALPTLSWRPLLRLGARLTAREGAGASRATAALSPGRQATTR